MSETEPSPPRENATTLDYQQRQKLAWVSRRRGLLVFLALCVAVAIPVWRYWQPIKQYVLWRYWFNRAVAFKMPAQAVDSVVDEPAKARQLALNSPDYILVATSGLPSRAAFVPLIYRKLIQYDSRLNLTFSIGSGQPVPFMGVLRRPDGTSRLVAVTGSGGMTNNLLGFVSVLVLPLPRWNDPVPPSSSKRVTLTLFFNGPSPTETRLRSGTRGHDDPGHVVFEFEAGSPGGLFGNPPAPWAVSATGIIDAYLQNDDSMIFRMRNFSGFDPNMPLGNIVIKGDVQSLEAKADAQSAPSRRATNAPGARR